MTQIFPDDLVDGYGAFLERAYPQQAARYRELAETGQTPRTLVIACCDSRAAPETIFNTRPGELFVVRNVANLVPPYAPDGEYHATSAALEFAVQSLRVSNIVVMGHARCGGIRAALSPGDPLSPGDFIGKWMSLIRPAAAAVGANDLMTLRERETALERVSIRHSLANLRTFPCIQAKEAKGRLGLHGAWFDIATGELWVMDSNGDFTRATPRQPGQADEPPAAGAEPALAQMPAS